MLRALMSYAWHDAELLDISVDRSRPGERDRVRLLVEWAQWQPHPKETRSVIEFTGCYWMEATMNFGVVGRETIKDVRLEPEHPDVRRIQRFFTVPDLFCWVLETNSTGSLIKIITKDVVISSSG